MKQNSKIRTVISALVVFGLACSILPATKSSALDLMADNKVEARDWLSEMKPVAGRNRRRSKTIISRSAYPQANPDNVQVSPQANKLRINVLRNDRGHKLRLVGINSRSAKGAQVSVRNGMAVYQVSQNFVGKDSFWYALEDIFGRRHSAKVIVCICDK